MVVRWWCGGRAARYDARVGSQGKFVMRRRESVGMAVFMALCLMSAGALAQQQPRRDGPATPPPPKPIIETQATRGKLLYDTHCIACHNSQIHWLDQKIASDWTKLVAEVRRWQARAMLQWSEDDILEVARHLNATIYRHPQSSGVVGQLAR
jgi:cytochrome c553